MNRYLGTFLAPIILALVIYPAERRYKAWKANRDAVPAYRNWRGEYVPDLWVKRFERSLKWGLALFVLFGVFCAFVIMGHR